MDNVFRILNLSLPSSTSFFTSSCFLSSQYSVSSLSLSLILWREVINRIAGHSIPYPTNSRNPSLEDMMPTILNSSIFYLTSTRIKLSKGHTFIWILCIRSNSRPFITYMVWLWFEFACVHHSNTMFLSLPSSWRWFDLWGENHIPCCAWCWTTESTIPHCFPPHVFSGSVSEHLAVLCHALPAHVWFST